MRNAIAGTLILFGCTSSMPAREDTQPPAPVEQASDGTQPSARLVVSFDGLGEGFEGPQGRAVLRNPSDNSLAVGPNHVVQTVNTRTAIFSKKGDVLYGPVPNNNFFKGFGGTCERVNNGDTVVRYDQLADRWLVVMPIFSRIPYRADQPAGTRPGDPPAVSVPGIAGQPGAAARLFIPPRDTTTPAPRPPAQQQQQRPPQPQGPQGIYSICYAISTSSDPLGSYYRYEFLRPYFPDYPRPAVWPDGYYIPTSTGDNRISPTVATQKHACVVEREKMLKGLPAREQCVIIENVNFLNNVDLDGKQLPPRGAPNIMLAAGGTQLDSIYADSIVNVWQFHVNWDDAAKTRVTGPVAIPVAPYRYLCDGQLTKCVPQPGTEQRLDSQGDKIMARTVYRRMGEQESIVAVHSVNTSARGGGVRWYEFRVQPDRSVALFQQGTYRNDGLFRWMASPAMDKFGNIGIGYSFGSAQHFPGQRFAGRQAGDRRGELTLQETVLVEGQAAQAGTAPEYRNLRWEDYTQTALDPSDDCTIWYVGDYVKRGGTNYSTRIGAFRMPGCK